MSSWIGVDFDRTLSARTSAPKESSLATPGPPVPEMVRRVQFWLNNGYDVRIVTARVASRYVDAENQRNIVTRWCEEHIGRALPVVSEKDGSMLELWDDSVVRVERNTGRRMSPSFIETDDTHNIVCTVCGTNAGRYLAFPLDDSARVTCSLCPISMRWDSIRLSELSTIISKLRDIVDNGGAFTEAERTAFSQLLGKDISR